MSNNTLKTLCFAIFFAIFSLSCTQDKASVKKGAGKNPTGTENSALVPGGPREPGVFRIFDKNYDFVNNGATTAGQLAQTFPVRDGSDGGVPTKIALLSNGEDSLALRMRALEGAKKSIRIQSFIFDGDESGEYVFERLLEKKKNNPNMFIGVITDLSAHVDPDKAPRSINMFLKLSKAGIPVLGYGELPDLMNAADLKSALLSANFRYHEKMWIIDGEDPQSGIAIIGGLNIANEYFRIGADPKDGAEKDRKERWRDQDMALTGSIVADIMKRYDDNYGRFDSATKNENDKVWNEIFDTDLFSLGRDLLSQLLVRYSDVLRGRVRQTAAREISSIQFYPATARFLATNVRPEFKEEKMRYIHRAYVDMIRSARSSIEIENSYFVLSASVQEIRLELIEAVKRGVDVSVLTNSEKSNDLPQMTIAGRYYYQDYYAANAEAKPNASGAKAQFKIYEWSSSTLGTLHSKFAVFDREAAIVGSYNMDSRSFQYQTEDVVVFKDSTLAGQLSDTFKADISPENAHEVSDNEAKSYDKTQIMNSLGGADLGAILQEML